MRGLLGKLQDAYKDRDPALSLNITYLDIAFRAALCMDVKLGRTFFLRRLPDAVPDFESLGIPIPVTTWLQKKENSKGLLLFSGAQASGKTTSAGAYIAERLKLYGGHGITYEHPVEIHRFIRR
jgi:twitching motility protein PilT